MFITNVLPDIGKFLDVEATVKLSQTCRSIHALLTVDPDGQYPKIKVPYFAMGDPCMLREDTRNEQPGSNTVPSHLRRTVSLSPRVLPTVHFPSLKRFEFHLQPQPGKVFTNKDDELRDSFVYLATCLESASNLEELHVDVGLLMKFDTFNSRMIYEVFAKNLVKCQKLRRIKIFNHFTVQGGGSFYSIGFLLALIPMLKARVSTLEEVTLLIGNQPTSVPTKRTYVNAARDLFVAILSLQGLKEFNLQLNLATSPLLNVFLQAADQICRTHGSLPSAQTIETFTATSVLYKVQDGTPSPLPAPLSLVPCLALLGTAHNLRKLVVRVPPGCWDNNAVSALKVILTSRVRHLGLYFHGYQCNNGNCLEYVLDYIQERENYPDNLIHISGLDCNNTRFTEEEALERYYSREGQKCLSWDERGLLMFKAEGYIIGW